MNNVKVLSDSELVREFVASARLREKETLDGGMRDLKGVAHRMFALDQIFKDRGRAVQELVLPFLDDPSAGVRYWSAMRLLPIAPAKSRLVIEQVAARGFDPIAADAKGTLRELASGQFKAETLWAPRDE